MSNVKGRKFCINEYEVMHYVQCSLQGCTSFRLIYTCKKSSCLKGLAPGDGYQTCNNKLPCKKQPDKLKGNTQEGESRVINLVKFRKLHTVNRKHLNSLPAFPDDHNLTMKLPQSNLFYPQTGHR